MFGRWTIFLIVSLFSFVSLGLESESCSVIGTFGRGCRLKCNCRLSDLGYELDEPHMVTLGDCRGRCTYCYEHRFSRPPLCQKENVAYKRPTSQSPMLHSGSHESRLAVDGVLGKYESQCTLTSASALSKFNIDLGQQRLVYWINIYYRQGVQKPNGFRIWLHNSSGQFDKTLCYRHQTADLSVSTFSLKCSRAILARFITLTLERLPLSICEIQVFECTDYTYGEFCDKQCNCENGDEICNKITGGCISGCAAGYNGSGCQQECPQESRKFGVDCKLTCHCENDATCDTRMGKCKKACHHRYYGDSCQQRCPEGKYLLDWNCTKRCFCMFKSQCDVQTGKCLDRRCFKGFTGDKCQDCVEGTTGPRCLKSLKATTNIVCQPGTGDPNCAKTVTCPLGLFGTDCQNQCRCRDDANTCNSGDGWCQFGCAAGYTGHNCLLECQRGRFGMDCSSKCHCSGKDECNHVTGACPGQCDPRYMGRNCSILCPPFVYGVDCSLECHCKETSEDCRDDNGHCRSGCLDGWGGHMCQAIISASHLPLRVSSTVAMTTVVLYLTGVV